ncbi:MAG: alpha/beta hydrolase [Gemmatimonadota bacterium]
MKEPQPFGFGDISVPVQTFGNGSRRVLFLPGMGVHPSYYEESLARLSRHVRLITPDLSFRSRGELPQAITEYRRLAAELARAFGPLDATVGHSFGGLVALLCEQHAIALSPTVPVRIGWIRKFGRSVLMQLREYAGLEGRKGPRWAFGLLRDYAGRVFTRPDLLFPVVGATMGNPAEPFLPSAPRAHVVLAERDHLYTRSESERYLEAGGESMVVRTVQRGHGWPGTDPVLFEQQVLQALD